MVASLDKNGTEIYDTTRNNGFLINVLKAKDEEKLLRPFID